VKTLSLARHAPRRSAPSARNAVLSLALAAGLGCAALAPAVAQEAAPEPRHGVAMHGEPALGPDFERLPYAAPEGAGGGRMAIALQGTYDSLNPYIVRGVAPDAVPNYVSSR